MGEEPVDKRPMEAPKRMTSKRKAHDMTMQIYIYVYLYVYIYMHACTYII